MDFFKNFLFYIGVQSVNSVVIVSSGEQRDSAIHMHVSISMAFKVNVSKRKSKSVSFVTHKKMSTTGVNFQT